MQVPARLAAAREASHREETLIRERYMRREIRRAAVRPQEAVVVCGAYHASVLSDELEAMSDSELEALPRTDCVLTLMPYSYTRLSAQSGYGAGNHGPGYFEALHEEALAGNPERLPALYFSEIAGRLRKEGNVRSAAEVIEAVRLAEGLAALNGSHAPALRDLRDAACTLLGQGEILVLDRALREVEIGSAVGELPPGVSRTALQDDFNHLLKGLKLERYLKDEEQSLELDLREDSAVREVRDAMDRLHTVAFLGEEDIDPDPWMEAVRQVATSDARNPFLSGYAAALLIERGRMDDEATDREVARRLSPGAEASLDIKRTIAANLRNYLPQRRLLIPDHFFFWARQQRRREWNVVLCMDQSGSMADSVVYGAVTGAILASMPALETHIIVFDTEVVDLTDQASDPVDLLFGVQLGGGTDINRVVKYCQGLIHDPRKTLFILITDLYEGGNQCELLRRMGEMVESGVRALTLLALSDSGVPSYDEHLARQVRALGIPCFGCTPALLPDFLAGALRGADLGRLAAKPGR